MICSFVFTVRRRDVFGRANDDADFAGVAAGDAFEFAEAQLARIDADAALGATVGNVDRGVLDRHPGRQRHHFGQRDVLVETHAALAGSAAGVVLHAVAFEVGHGAVIQVDWHIDNQGALGALEGVDPAREAAQVGGDAVNLLQVDAPGAEVGRVEVGRQGVGEGGGAVGRGAGRGCGACDMCEGSLWVVSSLPCGTDGRDCTDPAHELSKAELPSGYASDA